MRKIKVNFEEVIYDNTSWILRYIRSKLVNKDLAEDILQEVFIKAYRKYDDYEECGKLQHWLMRITQNTVRNYLGSKSNQEDFNISLDSSLESEECSLYNLISDQGQRPEEVLEESEAINEILALVYKLNKVDQQIFNYRILEGISIGQVAKLTGLPEGTVKSKTHYVLKKLQKEMSKTVQYRPERLKIKEGTIMCKDMYKLLFIYAKGIISEEKARAVESHMTECKVCREIVWALKELIPQLTFGHDDDGTHFIINFPMYKLAYVGISTHYPQTDAMNEQLREWKGKIPEDKDWFGSGHGAVLTLLARFDNEGNEMGFVEKINPELEDHKRVKMTHIEKVFTPISWSYDVYNNEANEWVKVSEEDPTLYKGHEQNNFGMSIKSGIYHAIPGEAEEVRIQRGNGILDCGTYRFAYVDRYVTEEERIVLDYTYRVF